jgi:carbonic anhydrase
MTDGQWFPCGAQTNLVMKMAPGDCFVQRNVGNLVNAKDLNCMCCLEYAVDHLKVSHVLVCGHYNCGAA